MNNTHLIIQLGICYGIMFLFTGISKLCKSNRLFDTNGMLAASTYSLAVLNFAGICWLGLIPLALSTASIFLTKAGNGNINPFGILIFCIITAVVWIFGWDAGHRIKIKEQHIAALPAKFVHLYFAVRILFLCGYELFFRGFLLFDGIRLMGTANAILLSTSLTVVLHVFTNKKEMFGCIPFGILLCSCCIYLQAVWPAMVLHVALCLSYELSAINKLLNQ